MTTQPDSIPSWEQLGAQVHELAQRDPSVAQAMREERTALTVAAAVAEIMEYREKSVEELAELSGIAPYELEHIVEGSADASTSVVTLSRIAASLNYRFGFSFVPKELPLERSAGYMSSAHQSVTQDTGLLLPDYREVL